jgi:hypothetical protein
VNSFPGPPEDIEPGFKEVAQGSMMEVALPLVAEIAKRAGGFPQDVEALDELVNAVGPRIEQEVEVIDPDNPQAPVEEWTVQLIPAGQGALRVESHYPGGNALVATIWPDGLVTGQGVQASLLATPDPEDATELEPHAMQTHEAPPPQFEGTNLRRVLLAPDQGEVDLRILTVELYDDGLIVRYVQKWGRDFDQEAVLRQEHASQGREMSDELLDIELRRQEAHGDPYFVANVEDDVGTDYRMAGGGAHGAPQVRCESEFTPAVPDDATKLIVYTDVGSVEIPLD